MPSIEFKYDPEKDSWNILRIFTETNSFDVDDANYRFTGLPQELIEALNNAPDIEHKKKLIDNYTERFALENKNLIDQKIKSFSEDWAEINNDYFGRLEKILNININPQLIYLAYLTTAGSCPYDAGKQFFMVRLKDEKVDTVSAHEIMHIEFIRTYGIYCRDLGLPPKQFADLKEALTVLLNEEMSDLFSRPDYGYKEHQELRGQILTIWRKNKDIKNLITEIRPFLNNLTSA